MPSWVTFARSPYGRRVRRAANLPFLRPAAVAGYGMVASAGARWLSGVRHARAVYLAGSLLEPKSVVPGISDVDLLIVADLPNVDAEIEFRRSLIARWGSLTDVFPIFYNLDYVDEQDAPFVSAFGQNWIADFERRFRPMAGERLPNFDFERPPRERANERLIHALLKWKKSGCHLLDTRLEEEPWILVRAAERLLLQTAARRHGASGESPLDDRLAPEAPSIPPLPESGDGRARVAACLAKSLEILEAFALECTEDWSGSWPVYGGDRTPEPAPERWHEARALASAGFESVYLVPSGPSPRAHRVIAVGAEGESPTAVVARASVAFRRLAPAHSGDRFPERPMIVTRPLWNAAALIEPSPFIGARLASGRSIVLGAPLPTPKAPSEETLRAILRTRAVELFVRPRTRLFRVGKASRSARLAGDALLAPAVTHALETGRIDLDGPAGSEFLAGDGSERALIASIRDWVRARRAAFAPELERRRSR